MNLSIVTVSMNRTEHLLQQARAVSTLRGHGEHIVLDFGSTTPISRDQLPSDERIKLHRVESPNRRWWLTHSYNLAFALASGDYILKLDADILPSQLLMDVLTEQHAHSRPHLMCTRLTLQDWSLPSDVFGTSGLFLCKKSSLAQINGFNPYIQGYGWDDVDLYSRFFLAGFPVSRILRKGFSSIRHDDHLRENPCFNPGVKLGSIAKARLDKITVPMRVHAQILKNKRIAIASFLKRIEWPSLDDYGCNYNERGLLPGLPKVSLFDANERRALADELIMHLTKASLLDKLRCRLAKKLRISPFSDDITNALLESCNINLGLVS